MPLFEYTAQPSDGHMINGTCSADNEEALAQLLLMSNLYLIYGKAVPEDFIPVPEVPSTDAGPSLHGRLKQPIELKSWGPAHFVGLAAVWLGLFGVGYL